MPTLVCSLGPGTTCCSWFQLGINLFFIWTDLFLVQIAWTVQNYVHEQKQFYVDEKSSVDVWNASNFKQVKLMLLFFYSEDKGSLSQLKPESLFRAS